MNLSKASKLLKEGKRITRACWNNKLFLERFYLEEGIVTKCVYQNPGYFDFPWVPDVNDLFATDWLEWEKDDDDE